MKHDTKKTTIKPIVVNKEIKKKIFSILAELKKIFNRHIKPFPPSKDSKGNRLNNPKNKLTLLIILLIFVEYKEKKKKINKFTIGAERFIIPSSKKLVLFISLEIFPPKILNFIDLILPPKA